MQLSSIHHQHTLSMLNKDRHYCNKYKYNHRRSQKFWLGGAQKRNILCR